MFPMETKQEKPISSSRAQSRIDAQTAPDWETNATRPSLGIAAAKLALRRLRGKMTPRQFGPTTRSPSKRRAVRSTSDSSAAPSGPRSRKPAEMTTTPGMPASPQLSMTEPTVAAGVQTTARSGRSPRSFTEG